jgi:hypothetical protein
VNGGRTTADAFERRLGGAGRRGRKGGGSAWARPRGGGRRVAGVEGCHAMAQGGEGPQPDRRAVGGRHQPDSGALRQATRVGVRSLLRQGRVGVADGWQRAGC